MTSLGRRILSVLCATALVTGMAPASAFAEVQVLDIPDVGPVTIEFDGETSAREMEALVRPFSLESVGPVPLKSTSEVRWIDRLDLAGYESMIGFYNALVEATDNDGERDFLIEDAYVNGTATTTGTGLAVGDYNKEYQCIVAYVGTYRDSATFNDGFDCATPYVYATLAALDRDHPEIFWMSDTYGLTGWGYGGTMYVGFSISDTTRGEAYSSANDIKAAIRQRDADAEQILTAVENVSNASGKTKYFNKWLTENNAYNTNLNNAQSNYRDAWECVSALSGKTGLEGPVCEGYARAFKVLCDRSGIPCVLVDGDAKSSSTSAGEGHMWNYVQIENGKWYAVDVTWNDPNPSSVAHSGCENENWFLAGSDAVIDGMRFLESHPVKNKMFKDDRLDSGAIVYHVAFTNGPALAKEKYDSAAALECAAGKHQFGEYAYNGDATCAADGTETAECLHCTETKTRVASGTRTDRHTASQMQESVSRPATCTEAGLRTQTIHCTVCGALVSSKEISISALGHAFGAYRSNGDAKVNVDGTETATCSRCGTKTTRTAVGGALVPAVGQTVAVAGSAYAVTGSATVAYAGPTAGATSATIPATVTISGRTYQVTSFAPKAFTGNKKLKSVKIGANIKAVPAGAFKGCTALTSVSFGANVQTIGKQAFSGCKALKSVTLGSKVTSIGDGAFQSCAKLTKVTVKSAKLKTIGKNAFSGCKKLGTITLKTTKLKSVGKNALKSTKAKLTVKVPKSKVKAYQKLFKNKGSKTVRVRK